MEGGKEGWIEEGGNICHGELYLCVIIHHDACHRTLVHGS